MLEGRVLVGHALHNDLAALDLEHPPRLIRDTSTYPPLMSDPAAEGREGKARPRALKHLAEEHLGLQIQKGNQGHDPTDDARCGERRPGPGARHRVPTGRGTPPANPRHPHPPPPPQRCTCTTGSRGTGRTASSRAR